MNIILLGSPGSGKDTQASLLVKRYDLLLFSAGELARKIAKKDERIAGIINSGKLIPEDEMTKYVFDHLAHVRPDLGNILFEGFPRFVSQYQKLEKFLSDREKIIDYIISLDISKEEAIKRISSRRVCSKCGTVYNLITNPPKNQGLCGECGGELTQRKDDNPEAIKIRFDFYTQNTKELIDYLQNDKKLIKVDGERKIEEIFEEITSKINVQ